MPPYLNTDEPTAFSTIDGVPRFRQTQFPSHVQPDLSKRGQITFTENNLINPLYIEEFAHRPKSPEKEAQKMTMSDALSLMPFREQMKFLKHQRAKKKNLEDQHRWKLEQNPGKLNKGLRAQLIKERQILQR